MAWNLLSSLLLALARIPKKDDVEVRTRWGTVESMGVSRVSLDGHAHALLLATRLGLNKRKWTRIMKDEEGVQCECVQWIRRHHPSRSAPLKYIARVIRCGDEADKGSIRLINCLERYTTSLSAMGSIFVKSKG